MNTWWWYTNLGKISKTSQSIGVGTQPLCHTSTIIETNKSIGKPQAKPTAYSKTTTNMCQNKVITHKTAYLCECSSCFFFSINGLAVSLYPVLLSQWVSTSTIGGRAVCSASSPLLTPHWISNEGLGYTHYYTVHPPSLSHTMDDTRRHHHHHINITVHWLGMKHETGDAIEMLYFFYNVYALITVHNYESMCSSCTSISYIVRETPGQLVWRSVCIVCIYVLYVVCIYY